jgi:Flp pilus assembly protein TadD
MRSIIALAITGRARWLFGLAVLAALTCACPAATPTNLIRLSSPHFALITDGATATANQLSLELEVFRQTVSRFLGLPREQRSQVSVYAWADRDLFEEFRPPSESKTKDLGGFHVTDGFSHALVVRLLPNLGRTREVLFHEHTHLLTSRLFRRVPVWMNEGLAEVFSTFQVGNRQFVIGGPKAGRIQTLAADGLLPAADLIEVQQESSAYQHGNEVPRFYASAWNLAHALTITPTGFQGSAIRNYIIQSGIQTNRAEAFRRAFGLSPREAGARAETLFRNRAYPAVSEAFDGATIPARTVQTLSAAEAALALGTLARLVRLEDRAEVLLRDARRARPEDPAVHEQLGLLFDQTRRPGEARAAIERALELGSVSCQAHLVAATLRWNRLAGQAVSAELVAREGREVRRLVERAIQLDPAHAACHGLLAAALLQFTPDRPREAEAAARQALQLDPYLYSARLTLAAALAGQGQKDEARRAVTALRASPLDPTLRQEVEELASQLGLAPAREP